MARILILTPQLPYPPEQGTSLRNLHLLRALTETNAVTLLSFAERDRSRETEFLRSICRVLPPVDVPLRSGAARLKQLITSSEPDLALRLRSHEFELELIRALQTDPYDAVQIEGIELARYIPSIRATAPDVKIVLDCHNVETELQRRSQHADLPRPARWPAAIYSGLQIGRLARFERWAASESDAVIAVSETDRDSLLDLQIGEGKAVIVVPNTIAVSDYNWQETVPTERAFDLVFTGKMDYRPNIDGVLWFADNVWPMVLHFRPHTTWAIVGQRPHPRLERLRQLDGVTLTGRVAHVQPYLQNCSVYIVPLRIGSGTRLKIIEAMAAGKPVVSTSTGAEGFPVKHGENILIADDPTDWVSALVDLLSNPEKRLDLGMAAREFAVQYDWRQNIERLGNLYANITHQRE